MEYAGSTRARAVSQTVASRPVRALCNRRGSRPAVRPQPSGARPPRPWRSRPGRMARVPSRSTRAPADYRPPATILRFCALPNSSPAPLHSLPPMEISAFPAGLLGENDVRDFHTFIKGFAHVVDCEGRSGNGDQGFHFHAGLGGRGHCGSYFHAILAQPCGHINVRQWQWVTKRYPLRGLLSRRNSRDSRHFQRIPLRVLQPPHGAHDAGAHFHKALCRRRPRRHRFFGHIDHAHFASFSVMRQLRHTRTPRRCPSSVTRKHSLLSLSSLGLPAPSENNSPSPMLQYLPSLATSTLSLPAPRLSTQCARAKNASARASPS